MSKLKWLAALSFVAVAVQSSLTAHATSAMDLRGEWDVITLYAFTGDSKNTSEEKHIANIVQNDDVFIVVAVTGSKRIGKGEEILKGELIGRTVGNVHIHVLDDPVQFSLVWAQGAAVMLDDGRTIIAQTFNKIHGSDVTITLRRRDSSGAGK